MKRYCYGGAAANLSGWEDDLFRMLGPVASGFLPNDVRPYADAALQVLTSSRQARQSPLPTPPVVPQRQVIIAQPPVAATPATVPGYRPPGLSTGAWIGIAAGGLAVIGLLIMASGRRR